MTLSEAAARLQESLDAFDADVADHLANETERADLWHDMDANAEDIRTVLSALSALSAASKVRAIREGDGEALSLDGFAETLTSTMEASSITVRGLSETLGIDKSAISRMRTGKPVWARHFIAMWNWVAASPATTRGEKE